MVKHFIIILVSIFLLSIEIEGSIYQALDQLIQQKYVEPTEVLRLANQQKISIPLNGRFISYKIKYWPQNASDCTFEQPTVDYKKMAQSTKLLQQDDEVISTLVLKISQKVILADPYFNIVIYSIDQHKLLRLLSPKTSLIQSDPQKGRQMVSTLAMITTQEEDFIYYLSPRASFVFSSKSFATQIQKIQVQLPQIQKALYFKSYVVILSEDQGIFVYKLDKKTHQLVKTQTVRNKANHKFIDIQLDFQNQLFYVLTGSSVEVYLFQPSNFPNPQDQKEFVILKFQDDISLFNYTRNHASVMQNNQHLNLQIAVTEGDTQIFILFRHMRQNVIAEFVYDQLKREVTFLRYFKFQMQIKEIHTINDVIVVVGEDILGMFPYGIDPRLITEEFNGWMTLSDISKIAIAQPPFFVGITKNTIQYGRLIFENQVGLSCQFNDSTLTKSISFEGNLTRCIDKVHQYNEYCSYNKKFILESMDIVTSSAVSSTVWIVILVCTIAIIFGIFMMLIMHKKKEEEIKKLQLYFEERRRTELPASSDRRGQTQERM